MNALVRSLATLAVLLTTALLLVADSPPGEPWENPCMPPAQSVSFAVSGTCGPGGVITLAQKDSDCRLRVEGAEAVNLPGQAGFQTLYQQSPPDFRAGGWMLEGEWPPAGNEQDGGSDDAGQDGGSDDAGTRRLYRTCRAEREEEHLRLRCEDSDGWRGSLLTTCEAVLTPQ